MSAKNTRKVLYFYERNGKVMIDGTSAVVLSGADNADGEFLSQLHVVDRKKIERNRKRQLLQKISAAVSAALIVTLMIALLFSYIGLLEKRVVMLREISSLEKQCQELEMKNDEELSEINKSINIDEIKNRAMTELGMTYADKGQVVSYSVSFEDYVKTVRK